MRLIKHNFPFIPPHCGVHIAQSRGTFPDHPAQTLFDLLNWRDYAISQPIGTDKKALRSGAGGTFSSDRDETLSKLPNPLSIQHTNHNVQLLAHPAELQVRGEPRTRRPRRSAFRFEFIAVREKFRRSRHHMLTKVQSKHLFK